MTIENHIKKMNYQFDEATLCHTIFTGAARAGKTVAAMYFVKELANGGGNFYDGWMKDPHSAMISCNDGFRPVSFYLEALDEEAEA